MKTNIFTLFTITFLLFSCSDYNIKDGKVYYEYWSSRDGILSTEVLIKNADYKTFEEIDKGFAKDKENVYYKGNILKNADPKSFIVMDRLFAKDDYRAYYAGEVIQKAKGQNFKNINPYFSTDGNDIFFETKPLNVCSVKKFKFVDNDDSEDYLGRWSTDGCYYYFNHSRIPSDDYKNVKILEKRAGFAKDKSWVYYHNRKVNFNDEGKKILDTVDVETFVIKDHIIDCRDKFGCINIFHGREKCN